MAITLNDAMRAAVGGGTLNDGLRAYYLARGAVSGSLNDLERQFLLAQPGVVAPGSNQGLWMQLFTLAGYTTGSYNDRAILWWTNSAAGSQPVTANKVLWLRKGVGVTQVANAVSQWADQSGNSNHLVQATGSKQPILQGDGTILFDGVDDNLRGVFVIATPYTIYARLKKLNWGSSNTFIDGSTGNNIALYDDASTTGTPMIGWVSAGLSGATGGNNDLVIGSYKSLVAGRNSTPANYLQVSGSAATPRAVAAPAAGNGINLASFGDGTIRFSNIQVVEVIVYNVQHTPAEVLTCLAYLDSLTP